MRKVKQLLLGIPILGDDAKQSKDKREEHERHVRTCCLGSSGRLSDRADPRVCDKCGGVTYDMYPHPNCCPNCGAKVME